MSTTKYHPKGTGPRKPDGTPIRGAVRTPPTEKPAPAAPAKTEKAVKENA